MWVRRDKVTNHSLTCIDIQHQDMHAGQVVGVVEGGVAGLVGGAAMQRVPAGRWHAAASW